MKKFITAMIAILILLSVSSCSDTNATSSENPYGSAADKSANDPEDIEKAEEMLEIAYNDFISYYRILLKKVNTTTDDEFKNYDTSALVVRDREDDVRKYFSNGYSIGVGADEEYYERDELLSNLLGKVNTFYENVDFLKDSQYRNNVAKLCNSLYEYICDLSDFLGEELPADIPKRTTETTSVNATSTAKATSTIKPTATAKATSTANSTATTTKPATTTNTTAAMANSRWDGNNAKSAMNGYSIIFYNGKAYLGTTYEGDNTIISSGTVCTYVISNGKITFSAVEYSAKVTMSYTGSKITDASTKETAMFEANYVFTKSYNLK